MTTITTQAQVQTDGSVFNPEEKRVILASSLGTVFEWYDFYLYGSLAVFFGKLFFPPGNETAALLASLATFGAGFAVRPFGALLFGSFGDKIGRKYTFLITIVVMGLATVLTGLVPTFESIGWWAPVLLVTLHLAQGLALGGEYGGAATYVAEHAGSTRRGYATSWIQTTATLGIVLSLVVILACRLNMSPADFAEWGWRIPFLLSAVLLGVSIYVRLKLQESPVFQAIKEEGKTSKAPLRESFTHAYNLKIVLLALFGAVAGEGVVWYTGQYYALFFLIGVLKVDYVTVYTWIIIALLIGTPFFLVFGALSDRIGRKKIMMLGFLLAVLTYIPIFQGLTHYANPALEEAVIASPVVVYGKDCGKSCDSARDFLAKSGVPYSHADARAGEPLVMSVGSAEVKGFDAKAYGETLKAANYPTAADPARINHVAVVALLVVLVIYVTLVYAPIAAFLVELFPTRIRYSSMSLPYHIGNGWFGGFVPLIATAVVVATGNIYAGLYYPMVVAGIAFVVGSLFITETFRRDISSDREYAGHASAKT
ncbi:MAG TPA: MFS transporter [Burkholderiaceae bacterium]|jgi:MFS family permease|nr:MFS transporter [Burkholderiaceae bacterium]